MKRMITIVSLAISVCALGSESVIPDEARVKFYLLSAELGEKIFYKIGGTDLAFYSLTPKFEEEWYDDVSQRYLEAYENFEGIVSSAQVPTAQKTANLKAWQDYMTAEMARRQVEQTTKLIEYQNSQLAQVREDDEAGREDVIARVRNISDEIEKSALIYKLDNEQVQTKLTRIQNTAIEELTDLNARLTDVNGELQLLYQKTEQQPADKQRITTLENSQKSLGVKINELKKAIALYPARFVGQSTANQIDPECYTNSIYRLMLWCGRHLTPKSFRVYNKNTGDWMLPTGEEFLRPKRLVKQKDGEDYQHYTIFESYQDQLNEFGNIAYLSSDLTNKLAEAGLTYPYTHILYEDIVQDEDDNIKTNVMATFDAPANWGDGSTITVSNGHFVAHTSIPVTVTSQTESNPTESHEGEVYVPEAGGRKLIFRSAENSDVRVDVSTNATGDVILTFGIYWK